MKLAIITSESHSIGEANLINQLFAAGMELLHLRKLDFELEDYQSLLDDINPQYYSKIVTHDEHELAVEYQLRGIHIKEIHRGSLGKQLKSYVDGFKSGKYSVSSSFHRIGTLQDCEGIFDYHFLGPIFDSISKSDYNGHQYDVTGLNQSIFAIGGITEKNILEAQKLGYSGVSVLGSIWQNENPVASFLQIKKACTMAKLI